MTNRFTFTATPIEGLMVATRTVIKDERGSFSRLFCSDELSGAGMKKPVIQVNHSVNLKKGTVRGMHYQVPPDTETKIVSCIQGEIFDVAVDVRTGSQTFLHWHGERLSAENGKAMVIPDGFAHGFQTLTDDCELIYVHTGRYNPYSERGLYALDPILKISWPLPPACLSDRDKSLQRLDSSFVGVQI